MNVGRSCAKCYFHRHKIINIFIFLPFALLFAFLFVFYFVLSNQSFRSGAIFSCVFFVCVCVLRPVVRWFFRSLCFIFSHPSSSHSSRQRFFFISFFFCFTSPTSLLAFWHRVQRWNGSPKHAKIACNYHRLWVWFPFVFRLPLVLFVAHIIYSSPQDASRLYHSCDCIRRVLNVVCVYVVATTSTKTRKRIRATPNELNFEDKKLREETRKLFQLHVFELISSRWRMCRVLNSLSFLFRLRL